MDSKQNPASREEPHEAPTGLKAEVTSFLRDASDYLQLRSELFTIEAKEAGLVYGKKTRLMLISGVMLGLAYLLILAAFVGILAAVLNPDTSLSLANWTGASLIFGGLHFLVGFFFFKRAKKIGAEQTFFEYTRNELQKEQEWLKQKRKP